MRSGSPCSTKYLLRYIKFLVFFYYFNCLVLHLFGLAVDILVDIIVESNTPVYIVVVAVFLLTCFMHSYLKPTDPFSLWLSYDHII